MNRWVVQSGLTALAVIAVGGFGGSVRARGPGDHERITRFLGHYCVECHNRDDKTAGPALDAVDPQNIGRDRGIWEKVVRKLAARRMPPLESDRPSERTYESAVATLANLLDRAAALDPEPGRVETFRRLTRAEYQNAVRDLLALQIDATALLPADESSRGFDNLTVSDLSPTLLERYVAAARKISRLALGRPVRSPDGETIRVRPDLTQEDHVPGLPLGTRGGALVFYNFPRDGDYEVQIRLTRDRNEHVEGLNEPHQLVIVLDREQVASFTVTPPKTERDHETADRHLTARIPAKAGPRRLGATFVKQTSALQETKRQPYQAHYNFHRHPRLSPAIYQISILGPYLDQGPGDTPSRRRILIRSPKGPDDEDPCARIILETLMRRAYRRPVGESDFKKPLALYRQARVDGDFEAGIEAALSAILVSPHFLFKIEPDPPGLAPGTVYRVPDVALASRLSFFLWSSIPDDELLDAAVAGALAKPGELERQARRMLADPRSRSLVDDFAGQWLHLRNLDSITPDLRLFPDFDDNLRQAFRRETELLFERVLREDRSVLELFQTDHAFLNERLAKHYGIPHVYGDRFRRVAVGADRGGLTRQGSILTATSYATRTSPVIRGKWILENLLGAPPPPPPANVPALKDNTVSSTLSVRARLAAHRADAACASCHRIMDPVGFALENYDAVGRYRSMEEGEPIDASGGLPDGSVFAGAAGLETALLKRPELLIATLAEKLLTFALGRGVADSDAPAVREIVRRARSDGDRASAVILGITACTPFQMRKSQ